ncbi:MAG TPA: S8 family serine peptidase [Longimicrobium sp.]|nr:S8 family serine peptidase [Longimicrobium sp.]
MSKQRREAGEAGNAPADNPGSVPTPGYPPAPQPPAAEIPLETVETEAMDLDPHLQQVVMAEGEGRLMGPEVLTESPEGMPAVDVLAKLTDPAQQVDGLNVVQTIGQIVTGTVDLDKIESVRTHPNVISLKRATRLHPEVRFSVPEIRADATALRTAAPSGQAVSGAGVIVGIVDYGCDFLHDNFRRNDGSSRLLFLWDQNGGSTASSPAPYNYGREYTGAQIDAAIQQASDRPAQTDDVYTRVKFPEDPDNRAYVALGYIPRPTPVNAQRIGNHGTHVMDIAAGNGRGSGTPGVAPGADLIFVEVSTGDFEAEESFGNSRRLLEAVAYIFEKAEQLGRPCVVNLSLSTHGGPHDGSTLAEQGFDTLLDQPNRAIVIAAGNSWEHGSHAAGVVAAGSPRTLTWQIGVRNLAGQLVDPTGNELEVWYPGDAELAVTLVTPGGQRIGPTALGRRTEIKSGGTMHGVVIHRRGDPNNGDNQIDVLLGTSLPRGDWQVVLAAAGAQTAFHAWVERDDRGQSRFAPADDDRTHTIGSISCGRHTLTVGSYDARAAQRDLSSFTAAGPTRDGKQKPEISAPGHGVQAAWSLTHDRVVGMSGTSMAAPHVTGLVALIMQAAGRPLATAEIRELVGKVARASAGGAWDPRYGAGRVDACAAVQAITGHVAPAAAPANGRPAVAAPPVPAASESTFSLEELIAALTRSAAERRTRIRLEIDVQPAAG